jgi:hypothetical protein
MVSNMETDATPQDALRQAGLYVYERAYESAAQRTRERLA